MRKLVVLSFITLDGVMQAPGGPDEDRDGGFAYGGWSAHYWDDFSHSIMLEEMDHDFDLLLGRKTFEIFAGYWPTHGGNPIGDSLNKATKHVATRSPLAMEWEKSFRIEGDLAEGVRKLKAGTGPELQVHGSGNMIQTLLKNDLVDELWLKFHPVTLGKGKSLFAEGTIPSAFDLIKSAVSPKGIIFANYKRNGEVKMGTMDE